MGGSVLLDINKLIHDAGVRVGHSVADFGVGMNGHLVFPAARKVGEEGRVFAVDIHQPSLEHIEGKRRQYLVHNLNTVRGDVEQNGGVGIEAGSLDVAFLVNMFSVLADHFTAANEIYRLMKPGGKIVVVDWLPDSRHPVAPPAERRFTPNSADVYFISANCSVNAKLMPSPWHWGRIYTRG